VGSEFELNDLYVNSIPFYEILNKNIYDYVDIILIDVEGGELDLLETMDWLISIYNMYRTRWAKFRKRL
jgi:hypothetical protein